MQRAAIYARFSSDRQNERSAEDQIDLCRAWAERQGFGVVETYSDSAVSGASTVDRMGLHRLKRAAKNHKFDIILAEALDRISRDQADLAQFKKEMTFLGVAIHTVQDGEVGAIHIGLKGLMGEMFLADLAQKTRRGLRARVKAGASAGGRSYGYRVADGKTGDLVIVDAEAAIVRRIFAEYIAGAAPRKIVAKLNLEGVAGPRGGKWNASTINGSRKRQNGILQNRLYIGQTVWNRQRFIKDPATGRRVSRLNPESEWIVSESPALAIIAPDTFAAAAAVKDVKGSEHPWQARKPRHLLSGIIKCGCCGGAYTIVGRDRLGCSNNRERGDCGNSRTVTRAHVEDRVLAALKHQLGHPDLIAEFVRTYHAERAALARSNRADLTSKGKRIAELTRTIDRIVDAVCEGTATKDMFARCRQLEDERDALREAVASAEAQSDPITLHPRAANRYRRMVEDLQAALASAEDDDAKAAVIGEVRKLLVGIVVTPMDPHAPVQIEVQGQLAELLTMSKGNPAECRGLMVAGTGFEPVTFRL